MKCGEQALPLGGGLQSLQARFEEIQGLEKEGRARPTDGATQESFDHWMQLQDKGTVSAAVPQQVFSLRNSPGITFMLQRKERRSQE